MKKLVTIVGARPQFIKAAAVSRAFEDVAGVSEMLVHTGQHYDANMSQVFFEELGIRRPACNLGIGSGPHGEQTGRMLESIERVLLDLKPDWLLVFGDTNSTLAGALAAAKLHIPVAHVEAGLRSFNRRMPEEINRILTDQVSDLLFAPTQAAVSHLQREGVAASRIHHVGDVMYDAALHYAAVAQSKSTILQQLGLAPKRYVLATVHRAENTEEPRRLAALLAGLGRVAAEVPVVLPLHPRTRAALRREGFPAAALSMLRIVEPVGYLDMIQLERNARLIATDSGGVQKEAFFHGVPCATLRSETEWTELVESGWNRLVRAEDAEGIAQEILAALDTRGAPLAAYGDGRAAQRIAARIAGETPPASTALNPSPNFTDRRAA